MGRRLAIVCGFVLLLALGGWQLQRREEKHALITAQDAGLAAPALSLERYVDNEQPFRRVFAAGQVDWSRALWLGPKVGGLGPKAGDGGPQYHLVAPLQVTEGPWNGRWLVVVWGAAAKPFAPTYPALHSALGVVRPTQPASWKRPLNLPEKNQWMRLDVAEIASVQRLKPFFPFALQETRAPLPGLTLLPERVALRDDHLAYAFFWFTLAALWVFIMRQRWR
jgi:surfeit locus 1 family protein